MLSCALPEGVDYGSTVSVRFEGDGSDPLLAELLTAPDVNVVLPSNFSRGDERGWLRLAGADVLTEDGQVWRERGTTAFQLLRQFCEGQNVDAFIDDQAKHGAREFRVLGMFDPWIGTFTLARDDLPRYGQCLLGLTRKLAGMGFRLLYTALADAQNIMPSTAAQQAFVAHVAELLKDEWNARGELCNECSKNGVDPSQFSKPNVRTLWSRGSGTGGDDPAHPAWDVADYHEARSDDYPRKNECRPYMTDASSPIVGVACFQSEPMGAAEVNQPGKRAGAVNGDQTQAINDFRQMGANFALNGPGGVFHSDAGITGGLMGPAQAQMATAFFQGLNFPPTDAYRWAYQRGDNCGDCEAIGAMPLQQLDAFELRIFCRGNGSQEWCVDIRGTRAPIARGGWLIEAQPGNGLVRLGRP